MLFHNSTDSAHCPLELCFLISPTLLAFEYTQGHAVGIHTPKLAVRTLIVSFGGSPRFREFLKTWLVPQYSTFGESVDLKPYLFTTNCTTNRKKIQLNRHCV